MFSMFRSRSSYDDVGTEPPATYALCPQPIRDADFIPLRLTMGERKVQRLMRGVMLASRYTDKVDTMEAVASKKRDLLVAKEIVNAFSGLIAGLSLAQGVELMRSKNFTPYEAEIVAAIEANRRYKIMNPDVLRTDYVKFLYMIQDAAQSESVQEMLGFNVVRSLTTIGKQLKAIRADSILSDSDLPLGITRCTGSVQVEHAAVLALCYGAHTCECCRANHLRR